MSFLMQNSPKKLFQKVHSVISMQIKLNSTNLIWRIVYTDNIHEHASGDYIAQHLSIFLHLYRHCAIGWHQGDQKSTQKKNRVCRNKNNTIDGNENNKPFNLKHKQYQHFKTVLIIIHEFVDSIQKMQKVNVFCVNKTNPYATIYILNKKKKTDVRRELNRCSSDEKHDESAVRRFLCVCLYVPSLFNQHLHCIHSDIVRNK